MKLSIEQYNEIFKNRSITDYTKFNWSGEMPVIKTIKEKDITTDYFDVAFNLKAGKYQIEVVARNMVQTGDTVKTLQPGIAISFNQNADAYLDTNMTVGNKRNILIKKDSTAITVYPNNWMDLNPMLNRKCEYLEIRISEYVENLIAESEIYQDLGTRTGDHYIWKLPNTTRSLIKRFNGSNFEYGDYRFNYNIDYLEALPKSKLVCFLWNNNKNKSITSRNASDTTSWTFTLTPENYTVGDDLVFEIYPTTTETAGTVVEIDNLYLCKIQDNWKCIDAGSIDYRRYFNEDAQKYFYGLASQLPERKPNGNAYIQSYNKVDSWPDFWNNTEVYLAGTNIYLRNDSITTEEALKTSLSGKVLMYEKQ